MSALGADDGIGFPVADPLACLDESGARRDRAFPGQSAATVVMSIALAALLPAAAQRQMQAPAGALVRPDVAVDRLVADVEPGGVAGPAGKLFWTPQLPAAGV